MRSLGNKNLTAPHDHWDEVLQSEAKKTPTITLRLPRKPGRPTRHSRSRPSDGTNISVIAAHTLRRADRAHHLRHPETHAASLPADRYQGALDPRAAGGRPEARVGVSTDKIFSFQRDLIRFRLIKHSGDPQMMRAKLEGDKLSIPEKIIQKAGLKDGDEVEVGLEDGKVVIKPLVNLAKFKRELRGCVESSKIDPLEAKRIWKA